MRSRLWFVVVAALCALCVSSISALALDPFDPPSISCVSSGENQITIKICGGPSGALAGVTVQWVTQELYDEIGWPASDDPRLCKLSLSGQPSLQHPGASRWELAAGQCEEIAIGDINFDETGVSGHECGLDPLECGTDYVFRAFAHAGRRMSRSDWTANLTCSTADCPGNDCTFTQGYWKTHGPTGCQTGNNSNEWPVSTLTLGNVSYDQAQLCSILNQPAQGNGLTSLAHQLIAAKFNVATGAGCSGVSAAIASADAMIGNQIVKPVGAGSLSPGSTSALTLTLDQYNNGILSGCPSHCQSRLGTYGETFVPSTWGEVKSRYIGRPGTIDY